MSSESKQHWLDRNRPPRVQITYDVETLGSAKKMELPLVVGILADLLGNTEPGELLKQRKFVQIDRDTFDDFMGKLAPTLKLDGKAGPAGLTFKKMEDFEPLQIVKQAPRLNKLLRERQRLVDVVAKLSGNDSLNAEFKKVFSDGSAALKTKNDQVTKRRLPFEMAVGAARKLTAQAQAFLDRLEAVASVIRAARQVHRVEGTCDRLAHLLPGEDLTELQTGDAAKTDSYQKKLKGLLEPGGGELLGRQLQALENAVAAATAADDATVKQALEALKTGPAAGLKALTDLPTQVTAALGDPTQKAALATTVKALHEVATRASEIGDTLEELREAASVAPTEKAGDKKVLDAASERLKQKPPPNVDDLIAAAESFAKKPSVPAPLQQALHAAFPAELELSQAQVLLKHQQAITDAAEARVIQAQRFMDPKSQEKALAARRDARLALETAKKIDSLIQDVHTALASDIAPEDLDQLDPLHARLDELHGAADAASSETQQQLDAF